MLDKSRNGLLGAMLAAALAGGCVTAEQVEEIVDQSNKEIVLSGIQSNREIVLANIHRSNVAAVAGNESSLDPERSGLEDATWQAAVARIEEFIDDHPGEIVTINALRIREAVVLLNAGQMNLARAVFSEIDRGQLGNQRDQAIYDAREDLIWWFEWDGSMAPENQARAEVALAGFAAVADNQEKGSDMHRFLEQARIRTAVLLADSLATEDDIRSVLDEAMPRYANQFDANDRKAIQVWHIHRELAEGAVLRSLRWYDYAPTPFEEADALFNDDCENVCPTYTPDWIACIADKDC